MILKEKNFYYAVLVTLCSSLAGLFLSKLPYLKLFGHLVLALIIGMLLQIVLKDNIKILKSGNAFISNKFLRAGIILLGFRLSIDKLFTDGKVTLLMAIFVVAFMMCLTYFVCRFFKVEQDLALLSSAGCGICGAAAVMGVSSQINAKTEDSVLAVAVVAVLGTVFTIIEVTLKPYLMLSDASYGVFAGASLHEIAHAVAAGGAGGNVGLEAAILMKLSRVLMLVAVILLVSVVKRNNNESKKMPIPYFILGFVATSIIGSFVPQLKVIVPYLVDLAYILLGMAMCALGMSVNFQVLKTRGLKVLLICFTTSFILMVVCYFVVKLYF